MSTSGTSGPSDRFGAPVMRREIRDLIKRARQAKQWTQQQLADSVDMHRTQINRIERAGIINRHQAERLGVALDLPDLVQMLSERERTAPATDNSRDRVVDRLFNTPNLETVTIVVADDLNVYEAIYNSRDDTPLLDARDVDVVFPTVQRERALFHGQPIYGHVEYQIKKLSDLQGSEEPRRLNNLRLFESDSVIASAVIARTRTGTECAFWTPLSLAGREQDGGLPVATGTDRLTTERLEAYAGSLVRDTNQIRINEALCMVESAGDGSGRNHSRFTRYFETATMTEEDVDENEGLAVALVLAVALCPRKQFGVARRVVTYKRPSARYDRNRLSLFSNQVDDADIRSARTIDDGSNPDPSRSRRGALEAALDITEYIDSKGGDIPDLVFQIAASREFRMFGLDVAVDRLHRVDLPGELRLIRKAQGAAVAPRLFVLELEAEGRPELDTLGNNADIEVLGASDMETEGEPLNDFLQQARECGFLMPLLEKLGVADR